jgi:cyclophilin family peptidyl-prolyl cis-trans isomerase
VIDARRLAVALLPALVFAQAPPASPPSKLPPGLYAVIDTSMGTITAELFERVTPNTVRNFIGLARGTRPWLDPKSKMLVLRPLYDNLTFHRVIPDFMIQTGDPTGTGAHNCGFTLNDEIVPTLKFDRPGRLAMANIGTPNSGACQFFITESPYPAGNGKYTIFGQVVDGQNVVPKITHVIRDGNDKPRFPVKLIHVNIVRIVPAVEQQTPSVTGPGFFVNPAGDILTSYQIVQSCTEIRLPDGSKLGLAVFDRQNDLALLHSGKPTDSVATFGEANGVPAGEPLAVGGKVMIKAAIAEGFLDANHVSYSKSEQPPDSEAAGKYTVQVQCWK